MIRLYCVVNLMGTEYVYLALAVVPLVIGLLLVTRFDAQTWLGKGLRRGDLYSLVEVASGLRPDGLTRDQAGRLLARGMVRALGNGHFCATLKGKLALFVRRIARQRSGIAA
jgi:hypothetical protein